MRESFPLLAAVGQGRHVPNIVLTWLNWEHLNAQFYLCLKRQVAAQLPDVGELQYGAHGSGISGAL